MHAAPAPPPSENPPTPPGDAPPRYLRAPVVGAILVGMASTILLFLLVRHEEQNRLTSDFARWAQLPHGALQRHFAEHLGFLRSMGAFYFSSKEVSRSEFLRFVSESTDELEAIESIAWMPRVPAATRNAHEAAARAGPEARIGYRLLERGPAGTWQPAASRAVHFPVFYVWPNAAESDRLGWDFASLAAYREAMDRAVQQDRPLLTPMDPSEGADKSSAIWRVFLATYADGVAHDTESDRRDNLAGYVTAALNVKKLAVRALAPPDVPAPGPVALQLLDASSGRKLYESQDWLSRRQAAAMEVAYGLEFGERALRVRCRPTAAYLAGNRLWQAWAVLVTGLMMTALLAAHLYNAAGRAFKVHRLVAKRTAELTQANQDLRHEIQQREESDRRLQQERYLMETLMDTIPDHIYFKDVQSHFLRINKAQAERFKLHGPQEAVGKSDFDFFTSEHAQGAFNDEQRIMQTGQPLVGLEERETWPDGSVTWVSTTKQCLRDPHGRVTGTFGISRDITAHKLAEQALAEKTQELIRSNKELEQFAYVASHDLQEPLRMIASYTKLLARRYQGRLDADADEFIQYAVDGAQRMQTLINDLLAYSRVGTRLKPFAPTDCQEALQRALDNLKVTIEESGAVIHRGELPTVMADGVQLIQLFQNLLGNAIKFRGERRPEIHVSATLRSRATGVGVAAHPPAQEWLLVVRDNGIGIDKEHFERVFAIFQRLHSREQYPGTGIGLAVCKKIVELHGGRIWVESEMGRGSTFCFTLPSLEVGTLDFTSQPHPVNKTSL